MGAIVIRTRYDEGTESAEVSTSGYRHFIPAEGKSFLRRGQAKVLLKTGALL